jgi:hypothetical protein
MWLEALGIVARGEGGAFIGDGHLSRSGSAEQHPRRQSQRGTAAGAGAVVEAVRQ